MTFRDPRGSGARARATLETISVSGLAFRPDTTGLRLEVGMVLEHAVLRIGDSELRGTIRIRSVPASASSPVGGLFYPETEQGERLLMTLISGATTIEA